MTYNEPEIIINGINVGPGCAMTIRVPIEVFADDLISNGLGNDDIGRGLIMNYLERVNDIRKAMKVIG